MADDKDTSAPEVQFNPLEEIDGIPKKKSIKKYIFGGLGLVGVLLLVAAALLPSGGGNNEPTGRHDIGSGSGGAQSPMPAPSQPSGGVQPPAALDTPAPPPPAAASEPAGVTKLQVVDAPQKKNASEGSSQQDARVAIKSVDKKSTHSSVSEPPSKQEQSVTSGSSAVKQSGDEIDSSASKVRCQVRAKKKHGVKQGKKKIAAKVVSQGEKTISPETTSSGRPGYQLMFAN